MPASTSIVSRTGDIPSADAHSARRALVDFERDLVAHFEELAAFIGLPRSYGEIYGLLYASPRPLSFADIQEKLDLSKGSVSQGLRALREVGAIQPAAGGDERREHFVPETELRKLIAVFLKESIQPNIERGGARVETMRKRHRTLLTAKSETGRLLAARLDKLGAWHRKGGMLLPLVSKFLG